MRVVIVNKFLYRLGGSQTVVLTEAELLRSAGWDVKFFGVDHPKTMSGIEERSFYPEYMELGNSAKNYSLFKRFKFAGRILYNFQAKKLFGDFLEHYQPDIIHCHNIYNHLSPSILHAAKIRRIPVVMTLHDYNLVCPNYTLKRGFENLCTDRRCYGGKYWHCILNKCVKKSLTASVVGAFRLFLHRNMRWFENNLKTFIAPSKFLKEAMTADGFSANQIRVLYNTYPFELFKFISKLLEKRRISEKIFNQRKGNPFIYVGRLSVEKGVFTLVKTFAEMPKQRLWVVGTGPQEFEIKKFIERKKAKNIKLLGFKMGEELWELMKQAYFFCMPSECFEVMPISLIEAFALGVPAIGAQVGGIPEILIPGKTGWLFEAGDIASLKSVIQKSLLINSEKYFQMAYQAQELVNKKHSPIEHIEKLLNIYEKALM